MGRSQVVLFDRAGATLNLLDRTDLSDIGAEMPMPLGGVARHNEFELADLARSEMAFKSIAAVTTIDLLVNDVAPIINRPFEEFSLQDFDSRLQVNSSAVFTLHELSLWA